MKAKHCILALAALTFLLPSCKEKDLTSIKLNYRDYTITKGKNFLLTAEPVPAEAGGTIRWRSMDPDVATVEDGLVTAVERGETYILASCGPITKGCRIKVLSPVMGVELDVHSLFLQLNEYYAFVALVDPWNAENKKLIWTSSNPEIVSIVNGIVQGRALGKSTITVTTEDGGFTDECEVEVVIPVTSISIAPTDFSVRIGESVQMTSTVLPLEATRKDVVWTSADPSVASVSPDGVVTGVKKGKTTITGTTLVGGFTAQASVTVLAPVTGIALTEPEKTVYMGERFFLTPVFTPANADDQRVTWTSDDESVATVDAEGAIYACGIGTAHITVTSVDGGFTASCTLTVRQGTAAVTGVSFNTPTLKLVVGYSYALIPVFQPIDAANKNVTWVSTDPTVATVSVAGKVTALKCGNTTIRVTTEEGGFTAECQVTVVSFDSGLPGYDDTPYPWKD